MKTLLPFFLLLSLAAGAMSAAGPTLTLTLEDCLRVATDGQPLLTAATAASPPPARPLTSPGLPTAAGRSWRGLSSLAEAGLPAIRTGPAGPQSPGAHRPAQRLDRWPDLANDAGRFRRAPAGLAAARARLSGAQADAAATRSDVRLSVQSAFYALASAQDLHDLAKRNLERTEGHLALARARHDAGAVPQADVLRVQAEVASAQLELINARSRVRTAAGQLNTVMGRPAESPLLIAPPAADAPPLATTDIEAAVSQAIARRPELKSGQQRVEAARASVDSARAARAPKLHADGAYGWNDTGFLPETKEWQVGRLGRPARV